jgi:hypothetical protein
MSEVQIDVKLNQQETEMVSKLRGADDATTAILKATVTESLLNAKRESMKTVLMNRTVFSITINDLGNIVVRGLGNSRPMGFRPDSLEVLLGQVPALSKSIVDARAYVAANPEKVAAATKLRDEKKAAEAKAKKKGQILSIAK